MSNTQHVPKTQQDPESRSRVETKMSSGQPDQSIPNVAVLMSTYNGERFLAEQIESILAQNDVRVTLFIRDDGSGDSTPDILDEYAASSERIKVDKAENRGVFNSFMKLLQDAGSGFDLYAFCDQDDYWKPWKLKRAAGQIREIRGESSLPCMYFSRLEFVDEELNTLGYSIIPTTRGFHNALVQNQATGCTVVLDREARNLISSNIPDWGLMHDWWCYLVISAFGKVVYDEKPGILYRKHSNNVTPATPDFAKELTARMRRFMGHGDIAEKVTDQAGAFLKLYGDQLSDSNRQLVQGFLKARGKAMPGRLAYALRMPVRRNTPLDNLIMRVLIVIGRF